MPRLVRIRITNYRSIKGPLEIKVPEGRPIALVGENNAGKSNIVRAVELMLGESWPGNHEPDDHEYFGRNPEGDPIECRIEVDNVTHSSQYGDQAVNELVWRYPPDEDLQRSLYMVFTNGETSPYVSNATREQCLCLVVAADRRLSYQLSYASKWTWLSKLMRQFHKSLGEQEETVDALQARFEEIKRLFLSVPPFARFAEELDRARGCARSRGGFGVRRRRSRASCVGTRQPAAARSTTAPRRRSGTPIGARVDRSRPSWRRTRCCGGTCRSGLAGTVTTPDGASVPGPGVRWIGRRHGRRKDRRWASSWSPEQIAHRLPVDFPDDPSMRISHEAIYQSLYVQGRGALRRELTACLRTGRALRVPRARTRGRARASCGRRS